MRRSRSRSASPVGRRRFSDKEDPRSQRRYRRPPEERSWGDGDTRQDRREKVGRLSDERWHNRRRSDDGRERKRPWHEEDRQRSVTDTPQQLQEKMQHEKDNVTYMHERRRDGGSMEGRRGNYQGRRSSWDGERGRDTVKPIIVSPMEVPKSNKYFTHDDRESRIRGGGVRRPKTITPSKWGHDMFDKMFNEEGTPPLEEATEKEVKIKSLVVGSDQGHEDIMDASQEGNFQALELYPEAEL